MSWLTTKASRDTSAHVVYRGRLSGPNLWLHYGFDGWQEPIQEIKLESIGSGLVTSVPIPLEGHITLDCVVTNGRQWDNNNGADYRLWIRFDPLDAHLHVSGKGSGELGLASLQNALTSAGVARGSSRGLITAGLIGSRTPPLVCSLWSGLDQATHH